MEKQTFVTGSVEQTVELGRQIGARCKGGEIFELVSDLGGGKTAFVRGLAIGIGSTDEVTSTSFTINNTYQGRLFRLEHFDFYRLEDPGVVRQELQEDLAYDEVVVAVEWADAVLESLPNDRIIIKILPTGEETREINFIYPDRYAYLFEESV